MPQSNGAAAGVPDRRSATSPFLFLSVMAVASIFPAEARTRQVAEVVARFEPEIRRAILEGSIPSLAVALTDRRVDTPPLAGVVYSNMAYSLVAHFVEKFSGVPYKQYLQDEVWGALGMTSTEFNPSPATAERLAVPYVPDGETGRNTPTWCD